MQEMNNKIFSNNLRKLRLDKNYTQEQVAEMLGVSAQSISRWECGNTLPDVMLLTDIAKIYAVTVDDLFKEDILAYKNYAQRMLAVFEATGDSKDFIRAEEEFEKLLESDDYTMDDLRAYGLLYQYMMKNCGNQAMKYFDRVINYGKEKDEEIYYRTCQQKIMLMADMGKSEENIAIQSEALKGDIDNSEQWRLLILSHFHGEQYDKAYEQAMKAIKRFPDEALIYVAAGDICRKLKKYDEALGYWSKALELDDTYLDAKYSIGFCYEELGDYEKAYVNWKELADMLDKRGLKVEMEFPLQLAKNCKNKIL